MCFSSGRKEPEEVTGTANQACGDAIPVWLPCAPILDAEESRDETMNRFRRMTKGTNRSERGEVELVEEIADASPNIRRSGSIGWS
jgi:hypothetical protein